MNPDPDSAPASDDPGKAPPLLEVRGVHKRFGPTIALGGVDLTVRGGEVHAVIGENGAGKSTLMNILCGAVRPNEGELRLDGRPYHPRGPADARRLGLAMIHQELTLAPHLTVEANILLGGEASRAGFLQHKPNLARAREALTLLGRADIDPDAPVRTLGIGDQQMVEIARALAVNARLVVMDEPTSSLSGGDRERLFGVIGGLKRRGLGVIYISHFLEEVEEIGDRYTVLRDGKTAGTGEVRGTPRSEWISLMVGRGLGEVFPSERGTPGEPVLAVRSLRGAKSPRDVSFELRRGEILGLAGLVGAGRTESLRAIFGLDPVAGGEVMLADSAGLLPIAGGGPRARIRRGAGLLSEDRKGEGLALDLSIAENMVMASPGSVARAGVVNRRALDSAARGWIGELSIRSGAPDAPVRSLSGGNQQKVAIARLLQMKAGVFLLDEPTRGIDIGSKVEIYRLMRRLAADGKAILFVSSYLPELLGVCDRIGVMSRGELVAIRPAGEWTEHGIMSAAATGRVD